MQVLRFIIPALAAVALLATSPSAAHAAAAVGTVTEITGDATVTHAGGKTAAPLKKGDTILENDAILTTERARLRIVFTDQTDMTIASKGSLVIDKYVYDADKPAGNKAEFSVLGLAFSYVGGLMEKTEKPNVRINLDLGSIGIRGTKILRVMKNSQCWVYLEEGKITVANKAGEVTLTPGEGTVMASKTLAPSHPAVWGADKTGFMHDEIFGGGK